MSYQCALHPDTPITHFCESCMDLVCQKCITKQPHSGSAHKIKPIEESANIRKNMYQEYVDTQLNAIRSESQKKFSAFENARKEYERDRKVIEKDIKIEFEAINGRLEDRQEQAVIAKQTEIKHLQNYVHNFDDISETFDSIYENPQGMLISYKTIDQQIRKLESLKPNIVAAVSSTKKAELNRQFETTIQKSLTLPQYEDRNEFLNKTIHKYLQTFQKNLKEAKANCQKQGKLFKHTYNDTFLKAICDQSAKICIFCGFPFTVTYVNQQCANNRTYKINCVNADSDWETIIPKDIRGSKRHYWVVSGSAHRKRPKMEEHSLIRKTTKKHYWNSLQQLQTIKHILKRHEINTGKTFSQVVKANDTSKTGHISKIAFVYTLSKVYSLPDTEIESLVALLEEALGINYQKLEQLLDNPTQDYYKFSAQEEEIEKAKPVAPPSVRSRYAY